MTTETMMTVDAEEETPSYAPHHIDPETAEASRRSLSTLIYRRQCYTCQQGYEESEVVALDPRDFIDQIAAHCAEQQDFLLPDTPMKEAIFRALLESGNKPMDAEQISAALTEKWERTPFPRDTSARVIQRLLDDGGYYCFAPVEGEGRG